MFKDKYIIKPNDEKFNEVYNIIIDDIIEIISDAYRNEEFKKSVKYIKFSENEQEQGIIKLVLQDSTIEITENTIHHHKN